MEAWRKAIPDELPEQQAPMRFTPFTLRDPSEIPPRRWLFDKRLISGFVSLTVSPGGLGKSSLTITEALAMVSGKPLLGAVPARPLKVTLWNGEDPRDEIERRIAAACIHYDLTRDDLGNRLTVDSGRDLEICIAEADRLGVIVSRAQIEGMVEALEASETDVLIIDPFVTTHRVGENDNGAMNAVVAAYREIADRTGCAIELVHHSVKLGGQRGTGAEAGISQARGASALVDGVRSARFLVGMTDDEAARAGLESPHGYFQAVTGKANLAPKPEKASWHKLESVALGNGAGLYPEGDYVGVPTRWEWPDAFEGVTLHTLKAVQDRLASEEWRCAPQATDWAGYMVADVMGLDAGRGMVGRDRTPAHKAARAKVTQMLSQWQSHGAISREKRTDKNRDEREFFIVGEPVTAAELSAAAVKTTAANGVRQLRQTAASDGAAVGPLIYKGTTAATADALPGEDISTAADEDCGEVRI